MEKIDIARQLALITGKPITEFFNGKIKEQSNTSFHKETQPEKEPIQCSLPTGSDGEKPICANEEKISTSQFGSSKIEDLHKMFPGSKIVQGKIIGGRQMTRKEYLKYVKGLTYESIWTHPLHYKLFRAEGQGEGFYFRWVDQFPKEEKDDKEQE